MEEGGEEESQAVLAHLARGQVFDSSHSSASASLSALSSASASSSASS